MNSAVKELDFETAAILRDEIMVLKKKFYKIKNPQFEGFLIIKKEPKGSEFLSNSV